MPSFEVVVHPARVPREGKCWLSDVAAWIGPHTLTELVVVRARGVRSDQHAVAAALVDGFDHQLADVLEDELELARLTRQIRADGGQNRVLAEVIADDARDIRVDRL